VIRECILFYAGFQIQSLLYLFEAMITSQLLNYTEFVLGCLTSSSGTVLLKAFVSFAHPLSNLFFKYLTVNFIKA